MLYNQAMKFASTFKRVPHGVLRPSQVLLSTVKFGDSKNVHEHITKKMIVLMKNNSCCLTLEKEVAKICNREEEFRDVNACNGNADLYHSLIYAINQYSTNIPSGEVENICDKLYFNMLIKKNKINIYKQMNNDKKKHNIFDLHSHNRHSVLCGLRYILHNIQLENRQRDLIVILGRGNHSTNKKANIRHVVEEYLRYSLLIDFKYVAKGGALHLDRYSVHKRNRIKDIFL